VLGICGGYQMLGEAVHDPEGIEGRPGTTRGLGLLPVDTVLQAPKTTTLTRFAWDKDRGQGYEIHMGQTRVTGGNPLLHILSRNGQSVDETDGCWLDDGRVIGTYLHGLFDTPAITRRWLNLLGLEAIKVAERMGPAARDQAYEQLADHFESYVDCEKIMQSAALRPKKAGPE
jgi:adenosylcobyric acid synthase